MTSREVVVQCESGLHARPAVSLMKAAKKYACRVALTKDQKQANAKSLVEILSLGANYKDTVTISCDGEDEEEAVAQLSAIIENRDGNS